ncbi:MAG: PucR family transcriptional regulator, partial [Longimicrobiales bacterium]
DMEGVAAGSGADESDAPDHMKGGLLAPEPGVYVPIRVNRRVGGVLIAHGQPEEVRTAAYTAAAAAGLALEFAQGASVSARQGVAPDLALHQLLRGSRPEARRAALVAKVMGWDLSVPRIALVVAARQANGAAPALGPDLYAMITKYVDTVVPGTPFAQLELSEWVLLPELSSRSDRLPLRQLARDIHGALLQAGVTAAVGIGESHAERSLPALRRSYREAAYAARCGERLSGEGGVFLLRDLGAASFLVPSPAARQRLAERLLQPLCSSPDILRSLKAFLDAGGSTAAAADAIGLHRHTIRNHLDRASELTGLDPRALDDAVQLRLAVLIDSDQIPPEDASPSR